MDQHSLFNQVYFQSAQQALILQIWDASCRGEADLVRRLLEQQVSLMVMTVEECWTKLTPDPAGNEMGTWFLEGLMNRLERNGNVVTEIEIQGNTKLYDCTAMCRMLLSHFRDDVTSE